MRNDAVVWALAGTPAVGGAPRLGLVLLLSVDPGVRPVG